MTRLAAPDHAVGDCSTVRADPCRTGGCVGSRLVSASVVHDEVGYQGIGMVQMKDGAILIGSERGRIGVCPVRTLDDHVLRRCAVADDPDSVRDNDRVVGFVHQGVDPRCDVDGAGKRLRNRGERIDGRTDGLFRRLRRAAVVRVVAGRGNVADCGVVGRVDDRDRAGRGRSDERVGNGERERNIGVNFRCVDGRDRYVDGCRAGGDRERGYSRFDDCRETRAGERDIKRQRREARCIGVRAGDAEDAWRQRHLVGVGLLDDCQRTSMERRRAGR